MPSTNARRPISPDELHKHLNEHLMLMERSCDAFDSGVYPEAKRISVHLRVLLHDTRNSKSLLGQLGRLLGNFLDTAIPLDLASFMTQAGLTVQAFGGEPRYFAPLDDCRDYAWRPFGDWWNAAVVLDVERRTFTRRELVLTTANQAGGAHVDPELDAAYHDLVRNNSLNWIYSDGQASRPIQGAEAASLRQIGHEVLKTLKPAYKKKPSFNAAIVIGSPAMHIVPDDAGPDYQPPAPPRVPGRRTFGRNESCPCGSGEKFKRCHGKF
jgi:hypothetical protein